MRGEGCGKRRYTSRRQARLATRKIGRPLRVYFCELCRAYHVTKERGRQPVPEEEW